MKLKELVRQYLAECGVAEATAVRVNINNVETLVIASDTDSALEREIGDGDRITVTLIRSATAGLSDSLVDQLLANPIRIDPQIAREIAENPEFSLLES